MGSLMTHDGYGASCKDEQLWDAAATITLRPGCK